MGDGSEDSTSRAGFNSRHRRGRSLAPSPTPFEVLTKGLSTVDFGQMSIVGEDFADKNGNTIVKIPTKFPPPPYLPGELERRAILMNNDSDMERQHAQDALEKSLFHYL